MTSLNPADIFTKLKWFGAGSSRSCAWLFGCAEREKLIRAAQQPPVDVSREELLSPSPARMHAAAIVFGLFGLMHVAAACAYVQDSRSRREMLRALQSKALSFVEERNGGWTWQVAQEKAQDMVGHAGGSFVELCRILGAPVVRLRAALPEELLEGDLSAQHTLSHSLTTCVVGTQSVGQDDDAPETSCPSRR